MAAGLSRISPIVPRSLPLLCRSFSSSLTSSLTHLASYHKQPEPPVTPILDLEDTERTILVSADRVPAPVLAVLHAMAAGPVVDLGMGAMRLSAVMRNRAVMGAVRGTVYRHFCTGEGVEEAARTLRGLWETRLRGIFDYELEDAEENGACNWNLVGFLDAVGLTSTLPPSSFWRRNYRLLLPLMLG